MLLVFEKNSCELSLKNKSVLSRPYLAVKVSSSPCASALLSELVFELCFSGFWALSKNVKIKLTCVLLKLNYVLQDFFNVLEEDSLVDLDA